MDTAGRQRVALIAGVTGIVGLSLAESLLPNNRPIDAAPGGEAWKVYGVARRPKPDWFTNEAVEYITCDLLDGKETGRRLAPLSDVTHLFYVTWTNRSSQEENMEVNELMLRNTLTALLATAKNLEHVCLQTGSRHYIGSKFIWPIPDGEKIAATTTFHEDSPRLQEKNFYYSQEDCLFEFVKQKQGSLTWSVHRPGIILGSSPISFFNTCLGLASYACICKHEGTAFVFTGPKRTWEADVEAAGADMVAKQQIWAATSDGGKNEAFNVGNGDSVKWKELWEAIAGSFGIEAAWDASPRRISLAEAMQGKKGVWEEIVAIHGLHKTEWEDLIRNWWVLDRLWTRLPPYRLSMAKSFNKGFHGLAQTRACLLNNLYKMRDMKLIFL